jgi:hypothetical protein
MGGEYATFQIDSADPSVELYDSENKKGVEALKDCATGLGGTLTWKKPAPTYTVTIPSDLTIKPVTVDGATTYKGEASVKATFANIAEEKPLKVKVTGANPSETSQFNLKTEDGSSSIPYTLKCGDDPVSNGDVVLTGTGTSTEEQTSTLTIEVKPEDVYAGKYTDTLTFNISLS